MQEAHVENLVALLLLGDKRVLHIDGELDVVADTDLGHTRHGAGIRIGQRYLVLAAAVQLVQQRLVAISLAFDRRDLPRHAAARTVAAGRLLLVSIALVEALHIIGQLFICFANELRERSPREVAILVVHRLDPGAIDGQKLTAEQVELPAQNDELPEHLAESRPVDPSEIGNGAKVRLQMPEQPDHLDVAARFRFQSPAGTHTVDIPVHVKLQKIAWVVTRTAGLLRRHPHEPGGLEIEAVDESLDEANRIVRPHIIINRFPQKQQLRAACS